MKLLLHVLALAAIASAQPATLPRITGPLPVTASSRPFLGASQNLTPIDLAKTGYLEEEYLVSGAANVYDWTADGKHEPLGPSRATGFHDLAKRGRPYLHQRDSGKFQGLRRIPV